MADPPSSKTISPAAAFDLSQLRSFVAVAEELHFGRAAARLGMTQPPLSRQIQVLESIVDAPLLERSSRFVRLTPAGQNFLEDAKRILKLADSAAHVARRIASGQAGSIKLGFTAPTAYSFLPDLVTACSTRLPDVDLALKEMVSVEQFDALASGQIDAGLVRPPVARPELASLRVVAEPLLAAVPQAHPLASAATVSLADLDDQPFVMYSPYESRYFYDLLATQFAKAEALPRYVQHLTQIHAILALVRAGLGLAIVPAAASSLRFDGVCLRPLALPDPALVELFLVWRRDHGHPLVPRLVEIARALGPTGIPARSVAD
jgi:DNA-binding transcriptional LysR family regulator